MKPGQEIQSFLSNEKWQMRIHLGINQQPLDKVIKGIHINNLHCHCLYMPIHALVVNL